MKFVIGEYLGYAPGRSEIYPGAYEPGGKPVPVRRELET
jgi:hypothetical protein